MKGDEKLVQLGESDVRIIPLGLGTWTWDSVGQSGDGRDYKEEELRASFLTSLKNGINFFDTAELYGNGKLKLFSAVLSKRRA